MAKKKKQADADERYLYTYTGPTLYRRHHEAEVPVEQLAADSGLTTKAVEKLFGEFDDVLKSKRVAKGAPAAEKHDALVAHYQKEYPNVVEADASDGEASTDGAG